MPDSNIVTNFYQNYNRQLILCYGINRLLQIYYIYLYLRYPPCISYSHWNTAIPITATRSPPSFRQENGSLSMPNIPKSWMRYDTASWAMTMRSADLRRSQRRNALDHSPCDHSSDRPAQQHILWLYLCDGRDAVPSGKKPCRQTDRERRDLHPAVADPHSGCLRNLCVKYSLYAHKRPGDQGNKKTSHVPYLHAVYACFSLSMSPGRFLIPVLFHSVSALLCRCVSLLVKTTPASSSRSSHRCASPPRSAAAQNGIHSLPPG